MFCIGELLTFDNLSAALFIICPNALLCSFKTFLLISVKIKIVQIKDGLFLHL